MNIKEFRDVIVSLKRIFFSKGSSYSSRLLLNKRALICNSLLKNASISLWTLAVTPLEETDLA